MTLYVGATPVFCNCAFPGCDRDGIQRHHVTYVPEVVKPLCDLHHGQITAIHGMESRRYHYRELSNNHRWHMWYGFIKGEIKPRKSHLTEAWQTGMMCLECRSRSLKKSRDMFSSGEWCCKSCGSMNVGIPAELKPLINASKLTL